MCYTDGMLLTEKYRLLVNYLLIKTYKGSPCIRNYNLILVSGTVDFVRYLSGNFDIEALNLTH